MSSYGAYYYKADGKQDSAKTESPAPLRSDRPVTAARFANRRRSITPPDGEKRAAVPYYQEMERPRNPGAHEERAHNTFMERPSTAYVPPTAATAAAAAVAPQPEPIAQPAEQVRPDSPDPSVVSDISEPEIRPNYSNVDYYTYSKCLERVLSDANLSTPIRLGVIGKWGAGKSKILKGILWCLKQACDTQCSHLCEPVDAPRNIRWMYRTCGCCDMSFFSYIFLLFVLFLVVSAALLLAFTLGVAPVVIDNPSTSMTSHDNSTTIASTDQSADLTPETVALIVTVSLVALLLCVICIAGLLKWLKDRYLRGVGDMFAHFRALTVMALCDTPPPPEATTEKVEMIPICFNASEYADSDESWSALTKQILTQCETMFGFWKSRLYRICSKDLEHEHDFLVADEDKWRYTGQDRTGAHAHRSLASAMPSHPKSARKSASKSKATNTSRYNGTPSNPMYRKPTLKTKTNKVVATEDNFNKKLNVPVHTAKWKSIGYPMLITIALSAIVAAMIVLVIICVAIDRSAVQPYHYSIACLSAVIVALIIVIFLRGLILLLHSACVSPEQRIERLRRQYSMNKRKRMSSPGFMHQIKEEIVTLVGFLRCMEHIYQRRFRLLLVIEDVDKCSDERVVETFNAIKVLFSDPTFPIVTLISMDAELVSKSLVKAGVASGQTYINQFLNMKFCLPDSTQYDIVKLLESQAEHLLCTTSVRVNKLKELSDHRYKTSEYQQNRREALRDLDLQHDYEEKPKPMSYDHTHYYSHPVHGRHISTARSRRSKSSKSKKRVIFTPIKSASTSEEGLLNPPAGSKMPGPQATIDKTVIPPVAKPDPANSSSPPESRKHGGEYRPPTADRPESQLTARGPPPVVKSEMRRENSTLADDSSDEDQIIEEPPWMLAMSSGEARKDSSKDVISIRRPQLADSEKTEDQLAEQHIHSVAEMKVMLGVSQGLITALVNNPSYELSVSYESGLGSIKNTPMYVNLHALSEEELKKHILAYGLRRRMVYLALDEVRFNIKLLDNNFSRITQLFNSVYLSVYIWVQKLKQLGLVDAVLNEKESDKAIVKLIKTCQELTRWVMLCELWPYRVSWLIYKVERVNRKMGDFPSSNFYLEASIRDIYKDIRPDMKAAKDVFNHWRQHDYSDTVFKKCLERFKDISGLSVLRYLPFTINIDRLYKNSISQYMAPRVGLGRGSQPEEDGVETQRSITFADGTSVAEEQT